jgi:hypothetical protein
MHRQKLALFSDAELATAREELRYFVGRDSGDQRRLVVERQGLRAAAMRQCPHTRLR